MKKIYGATIVFIVIDVIIVFGLCLVYGPLRNQLMSSLMNSENVLYTLWNQDGVWQEITKNEDVVVGNDTLVQELSYQEKEISKYEKEILTKNPGEEYKLVELKIDGYNAYMVVIYDPSKVELIHSKTFNTGNSQETVINMCKRYGGAVCINGGRFRDWGSGSDIPVGYIIDDGKVIWPANGDDSSKGKLIGMTKDNRLVLMNTTAKKAIEAGVEDALEFGPFLIVDGKEQKLSNYAIGGYLGAARVAIGQRKDGIMLFLVADGVHGNGVTIKSIIKTFQNYGVVNAANLDGGASSQLVIKGKLVNHPKNIYGELITTGRRVVSGFGLIIE